MARNSKIDIDTFFKAVFFILCFNIFYVQNVTALEINSTASAANAEEYHPEKSSIGDVAAGNNQNCTSRTCCAQWSQWGHCTVSCGNGTRTRTRRCSIAGQPGGVIFGQTAYLSTEESQTESCSGAGSADCPIWSDWTPYSACSASCGGGTKMRNRTCSVPKRCEGSARQSVVCNKQSCAIWGDWEPWTECTVSCGRGSRSRTRYCSEEGKCIEGSGSETEPCAQVACPQWSPWGPWGGCSATCGGGLRKRGRVCSQYNLCPGSNAEKGECDSQKCPEFHQWSEWSACSASCNGGSQERKRDCDIDQAFCARNSTDPSCTCDEFSGKASEVRDCNEFRCPEWGPWKPWSACSEPCGNGSRSRNRECNTDEEYCATNANEPACKCGDARNSKDVQTCNAFTCAHWSEWLDWGQCTLSCGGGGRERKRTCISSDVHCTGDLRNTSACRCPGLDHANEQCNVQECPEWGGWQPWGECSTPCGGGTQNRSRTCSPDTSFCALHPNDTSCRCDGETSDSRACNTHRCAAWGAWGSWAPCSLSCGNGTQQRHRKCEIDKAFCGTGDDASSLAASCRCVGADADDRACNTERCPAFREWSDWTPCSASCGGGTKTRNRTCDIDSSYCVGEGATSDPACSCQGEALVDKADCNTVKCPTWSEYGEWSQCSVTCGGGNKTQTRKCQTDAAYCTSARTAAGAAECNCINGTASRSEQCATEACPSWQNWDSWGSCSVTCGQGKRSRKRSCSSKEHTCVVAGLNATDLEVQRCDKGPCYQWSDWSPWNECSVVCGGGNSSRARKCPVDGGCPGLNSESSICNQRPCPDWGAWSEWASCSVTCGGGSRVRTRACPLKDQCHPGSAFDLDPKPCSPEPCPIWTEWSDWGTCSATCGDGNRFRSRICHGANDSEPLPDGCPGRGQDVDPCTTKPCPPVIPLSPWSDCSKTCGGGTKTRSKTACPEGPPKCPVEDETAPCNEQLCPVWEDWSPWSECSVTCGGGQRSRKRSCPIANGCVGQSTAVDPEPCSPMPCLVQASEPHPNPITHDQEANEAAKVLQGENATIATDRNITKLKRVKKTRTNRSRVAMHKKKLLKT